MLRVCASWQEQKSRGNEQDEDLSVLAIPRVVRRKRTQVFYVVPHSSRESTYPQAVERSASDPKRRKGLELDRAASELGPPEAKLRDSDENDLTSPESTKYWKIQVRLPISYQLFHPSQAALTTLPPPTPAYSEPNAKQNGCLTRQWDSALGKRFT